VTFCEVLDRLCVPDYHHLDRFPTDFMFQLSKEEHESLRRYFGTLKRGEHSPHFIIYPQADGKGLTRACKIPPYEKNMRI
jgi:hypothetical protein